VPYPDVCSVRKAEDSLAGSSLRSRVSEGGQLGSMVVLTSLPVGCGAGGTSLRVSIRVLLVDAAPHLAILTWLSGDVQPGFDPVALFLLGIVVGVVAALGIAVLRRRRKIPRAKKSSGAKVRQDVIRRDLNRMAEYAGEFSGSEPAVSQSFEPGLAAMRTYQWDEAIELLHEAKVRVARAQLVPLLVQVGVCHFMRGSLVDALEEFGEACRLSESEGDKEGKASALANMGVVRHEFGQHDNALEDLNQALAIARESDKQRLVALCLGNIGTFQRYRGQLDDALKSHERALDLSRRIGDEPGVVSALVNAASVRRDKGQLAAAREYYEEAVEIAVKIGDNLGFAVGLGGIGGVYLDKGELDKALKSHEESLDGARRIDFRLGVATGLGNTGLTLEKKGAHEQAVPSLAEALAILLSVGVRHGRNQALLGLLRCDEALGRDRLQELLKQASVSDEGVVDLVDRIDQVRQRRNEPTAQD